MLTEAATRELPDYVDVWWADVERSVYAVLDELDLQEWTVVPKEPTCEMALAADRALVMLAGSDRFYAACDCYMDMVSAAPKLI